MFIRNRARSILFTLAAVAVVSGCSGTQDIEGLPSNSALRGSSASPEIANFASEVQDASAGVESSLPSEELAAAAGISPEQVRELVDNQGKRIALTDEMMEKFPDEISYVWTTDPLMRDLHVSATTDEALKYAKSIVPNVTVHLVKYSYSEMENIYEELLNLATSGICSQNECFVNFEAIESKIYVNLKGLNDRGRKSAEYSKIKDLIKNHPDLIIETDDIDKYYIDSSDSTLLNDR